MSAKRQTYSSPCSLWDCICLGIWHMPFLGSLYPFKEKFLGNCSSGSWWILKSNPISSVLSVYLLSLHFSMALPRHVRPCSSKSWIYQPVCFNFLIENMFHFYTLYIDHLRFAWISTISSPWNHPIPPKSISTRCFQGAFKELLAPTNCHGTCFW